MKGEGFLKAVGQIYQFENFKKNKSRNNLFTKITTLV